MEGAARVNGYARLSDVKTKLRITSTAHDAALVTLGQTVSRYIDDWTGQRFYAETGSKTFNWWGRPSKTDELWLPAPLISASAFAVDLAGTYAYGTALSENTHYWLWPYERSNEPYLRADLVPNNGVLSSWPTGRRTIRVTGKWGYSDERELATAVTTEDLDASETGVDVASGTAFDVGETIYIDSEAMYIRLISTNTLGVVRAINGTTAATHTNGASVYRRRYPRAVEQAAVLQIGRLWQDGMRGETGLPGEISVDKAFLLVRDLLQPFRSADILAKVGAD
jgi:hypothetical protein